MKTFTNCAEKKAKQILNLLQGYTKGIRITAILILLLMGVNNAWAASEGSNWYDWASSENVYFDNTNSSYSNVSMLIGRQWNYDSDGVGSSGVNFTKVDNTNNLYHAATTWNHYNTLLFMDETGWGWEGNKVTQRYTYAKNYTNTNNININGTELFYAASSTKGATLNHQDLNGYAALNSQQTIQSVVDGTVANSKATISITSYKMTAHKTTTEQTATLGTGANVSYITAARTAITTLTVGDVATGYQFDGWYTAATDGTQLSKKKTYTYYPTAATTVYARFSTIKYTVTYGVHSSGNGTLTAKVGSTSITSGNNVNYGSEVVFTATPSTGYEIEGWYSNADCTTSLNNGTNKTYTIESLTAEAAVYVKFKQKQHTVNFGVHSSGNGTLTAKVGNTSINFGDKVNYGSTIVFTAEPSSGYQIEGWYSNSACTEPIDNGTNDTYTVTITGGTNVYVKFVETAEVMSKVTVTATEGGAVSPSGTVEVGNITSRTFTATPASGYRFDQWEYSGGVVKETENNTNEQGSIKITADGDGTLTAHFVRVHTLNYFATPAAAGSVTAQVDSKAIASGDKVDANTKVTFTASVQNTYNGQCTFVRWVDGAGNPLSNNATYTHTVKEDITVKAIFKITQYTLTFSAGDGGFVSAKANNSNIASPANLDYNTSVTLTATPNANCEFDGWYEGSTKKSSNASYTINLTADKTLEARFTKGTTIFFKPVDYWKADKARLAVYMWNSAGNKWIEFEDYSCNGDIYTADIPAGYTDFKFVRLRPATADGYNSNNDGLDWNNKWGDGETENLNSPAEDKNLYDMTKTYIHLKPNSNWTQASARFAAYFFGNGEKWVSMTDTDGDGVYSCEKPSGFTKVILCRMNPANSTNNWNNKWNKSADQTISDGNNCFTVNDNEWGDDNTPAAGSWSKHWDGCQWTTYSAPSYKLSIKTPENGTITVTKDGNAVANGATLNLGDEIKITFTPAAGYELSNYLINYASETETQDVYTVCGPTKIIAEFDPITPSRTVYLRPNEDWLRDNPIMAAYAYNNSGNRWYVMNTTDDDYTGAYSCKIPSAYDKVIFVRLNPNGSVTTNDGFNFDNAWNQTIDLLILDKDDNPNNDKKLRFAIGAKTTAQDKNPNHYDGAWEENTPIWGMIANFNDWKAEKAVFKGYPGHLDVMPPFGTSHAFKLYNFFGVKDQSEYFGNAGTMKRANSGQWWTMDATEQANCQMTLDVKGDYIYQMRFLTVGTELRKQISVTYPSADMYYIMYEETGENDAVKQRISYGIRLTGEERLDTVSFFVDVTKSAKIYILDDKQTIVGDPYTIIGTIGQNPTGAQAPQRRAENNPELLIEEGCGITESGVYNFVAQQDANKNVTLLINDWHAYTGAYYIRTDAASGGWGGYKQNGNKMTYTSYADKNHNFDHYYCKWVESDAPSYANVKFCVANDYSHKLSDEWDGDEVIEKANVPTGCLPEDANVRFGWNSKTNELSRAYIAGSSTASDRFLVLEGNEDLKDINGNALNVSGLNPNEAIFSDKQNWIYQLDVQANNNTEITLTAKYNGKVQTFFGTSKSGFGGEPIMQATNNGYHKVRMIYDFKTNNLIAAWLLNTPVQETEAESVASNMLIIRENQGDANQINFTNNQKSMEIYTAYAVMTFTKEWVKGENTRDRSEYWVSFPFDVKISDVFGFSEYGDQWIMQLYDGAERAEKGNWIDSPTFWKYITNRNYTLKAGVGYVLKLNPSKMTFDHGATDVSLFFPSQGTTTIINAEPTPITVPAHTCTIERDSRDIKDSHWNLIGVPGYANLNEVNTKYTTGNQADGVNFYYAYDAQENKYAAAAATATFKNMHAYMVQFAGTINWKNDPEFNTAPQQLAARRNSDVEPEKRTLRLEIAQGEEVADQTFVQLQQEGATPEFDMNLDLTKIINSGANIYTLAGDARIQVAGNALPVAETTIPVGVQMATAGEYTFRMPDGTEGMVVELIDYETNTRTNLLLSDYTTTLPAGSFENRFALIVKPDKVATDVENIGQAAQNGEAAKKYIIDGKLFLQKNGMLYDAQGHIVR